VRHEDDTEEERMKVCELYSRLARMSWNAEVVSEGAVVLDLRLVEAATGAERRAS
jgi:hypothetical protein